MTDQFAPTAGPSARTVVVVNPSHATTIESTFWHEFATACSANGWRLVQIAARRIPSIPDADTFTFPARLVEFHRWARGLDRDVPWLDNDTRALHVEWEHRRWELAVHEPTVWDAVGQLAGVLDLAMEWLRPAVVLTTNKIDHPCALGRAAAQHRGVPVVALIERSPFESMWFEPDGLFTESAIWQPASRWRSVTDAAAVGHRVVERLLANPAGFRAAEVATSRPDISGLRRPLVLLPLDNILWTGSLPSTQPQGATDYPILRDPAEALAAISAWVGEIGGSLIVKPHPSCVEAKRLFVTPPARVIDAALGELLAAADVTVAFNTKVAFASLAAGVPTVTLAQNPAAAGGHTFHWSEFGSAADAMRAALDDKPRATADGVAGFFGQLEVGHFYGSADDAAPSSGASDLVAELQRLTAERSLVPHDGVACERLRRHLGQLAAASPPARVTRERRRVVITADRLVDPNAQMSGIARYGWELVAGLEQDDRVEVQVVLREPTIGWHRAAGPLFDRLHRLVGPRLVAVAKSQREDVLRDQLGTLRADDVVHSIHLPLPSRAMTGDAARVITIHDVLHLTRPELSAVAGTPTIERVIASIDSTRDFVICDSEHTRRDLLGIAPIDGGRIATVLLGVAPPRVPTGALPTLSVPESWDGFVITMLQSEPRKNTSATLEALRVVLDTDEFSRVGVVAVGTVSAIRQHRDDLDAVDRNRIVTLSDLTDEELHHLLRGARAFVYGSLYEGFGLPPLEAMAAGCPVVVVANSSLVEVVGDAGLFAHSGSAEDIAGAVRLLLSSASLRDELANRGRQRASELTWGRTVSATIAIYQKFTERIGAVA